MLLLTSDLRFALRANAIAHAAAQATGRVEPDPASVVKFFNPCGAATWLATELDQDGVAGESRASPRLFGLADLGFGCPELGSFSLREIAAVRLPFGLTIERDLHFETPHPISVWAEPPKVPAMRRIVGMAAEGDAARLAGSILGAAHNLESGAAPPCKHGDADKDDRHG